MQYDAVIFDLDGTLLDSLADLADATNYALRSYECPEHELDAYRYFVGDGVVKLISRALPGNRQELLEDVLACQREYYTAHCMDKTAPYPGIMDMLHALQNAAVPVAVLSNKPDDFTRLMVERIIPDVSFAVVQGHRQPFAPKPDPGSALNVAEQLDVAPDRIAYVGDTATDMRTAVGAGMYPVGVLWGFRDEKELQDNGASVIIAEPRELLQVVGVAEC